MTLRKLTYTMLGDNDKIELEFEPSLHVEQNRFTFESMRYRIALFLNIPVEKVLESENHDWIEKNEQ